MGRGSKQRQAVGRVSKHQEGRTYRKHEQRAAGMASEWQAVQESSGESGQ